MGTAVHILNGDKMALKRSNVSALPGLELFDRQGAYHRIFSALAHSLDIEKIAKAMN